MDDYGWYSLPGTIKKVVIENGVTSIGDEAFAECSDLTSITIPNSVTSIGSDAFFVCSSLTSVTIPNSVTKIGDGAFSYCSCLTSITIPNSVTSIGSRTFYDCSRLTSVTIPNSMTSIGEQAFTGCSGLTSITIPNSVTSIGSYAFSRCSSLTSVTIPNSLTSIGWDVFYGCSGLTSVTIPNSVTSIGRSAFSGCSGLTSVTIPNSVTSIGESAFSGCSGLTSITIPNSVTSIEGSTFSYCKGLTSVTIPNSVTSIGRSAFSGCSGLTSVTIPNSVTSIGRSAFSGCSGLTSVTIPNSVTSIESDAFSGCSGLTSIIVKKGNTKYDSRNDCDAIIETQSNILIAGCKKTVIPNSVTSIGNYAFEDCSGLTSITIPNSVTSIEAWAFKGCKGITSITIPNSVTSIGDDAFYGCSSLTSITIPNSVTSIGWSAFSGCSGLTSITIPYSVTSIGRRAFSGCSGLTSITIPYSVTSIEAWAFSGCSGLTSITIPNSITSIDFDAFSGCKGLTSITCEANTPPNCNCSFTYVDKSIPVYVPANSIEAYKAADEWKNFTNIQAIPTYIVTLDHNKGVGDPEQITVAYNQPMPENIGLVAPTRTGYEFTGYSRSGTYYYDANLKSVRNFDQKQDYTLYANWKARTTTVTLNPQGGQNATIKLTATYGKAMPTGENIVAPTRAGYTFEGYYSSTNGNGTQYYNADMTSKRTWNKEASSATLYAYWKASSIPVAAIDLSATSATLWVGKSKTITATVSPTTATKTSVTWSSSNTQVATVSSKGVVKAIGKGTCVITCTAADGYGAKAECKVTVKQQVTSIDFGYETLSVTCGTTKTLTPKINPSNASVQTLSWKSKNTSVATVTSAGVLKAIAPGTAQIICTATDGFKKADTITVEVVPLKITDSKPTIAEGTYGIGGIVYTRTLTEGKYAAFCLPYNVNLNDYTDEFAKVYVPMGMTFLKPTGTLVVAFKKVSLTETIRAGKPFVALAAKSGAVAITNDYKKTFTALTNPEPTSLTVYNWNGSNGFFDFNPDVTTKIGGTYSKLTGLDSEKYYLVSTSGAMSKAASVSPYRIYVYKDDKNSNAKVTEIIFSFDEDEMATGIENITNEQKDDDKIYNINGQRINKANAQKGIYIKNGKKYANKN